ncbi:hypothetical protein M422DRAFT_262532 [Sphaerobolus stellatus SS14]|uniref:Unplaced genomic scaffold SPHSTscaffold_116, whole genome shotgun sequence n=1 Tax=Sphaerobolus stellatus (strain SS14) TaxID=990650 RepID=A0A0C9UJV8_SPHS4|nr:hypothetical protein M422DRAFT_262532 [Sphaerobolus stellatus SS14]
MSDSEDSEDREDYEALPLSLFNRNPQGHNQHPHCSFKDDKKVKKLLCDYDWQGVKSPETISQLLTVSRRKKDYGLMNSHKTTITLPETVKCQLVLDELERDPGRRQGPPLIKEAIHMRTGIDLTRAFVEEEMQFQDPEGFQLHDPTSKRIKRRALVNISIHEEWSGDGHDKLKRIGLAIYGRGWSQLKFQFDVNVDEFWDHGFTKGIYDVYDDAHIALARWLWAHLVQKEINAWKDRFNAHAPHKDPEKVNPSGVAPNIAFALYERYSGVNCLRKFTPDTLKLVSELKGQLGTEESLQFVPKAFTQHCETALASLKPKELAFTNIWAVFEAMLPLVFEEQL